MAHHRRGRKGLSHDILGVTELDDDLEEFSLSNETSPSKSRTSTTTTNGHVKTNFIDPFSTKTYKDPLRTISVKDPFEERSKLNFDRSNKAADSLFKNDRDLKRNTTQSSSAGQTTAPPKSVMPTQNSSHVTNTVPMRGVASTLLNKNNPSTSIHTTKRYNSTPRNDKNKKGYSHEERDLYIDDIEDF